jgi:hypothetical protein
MNGRTQSPSRSGVWGTAAALAGMSGLANCDRSTGREPAPLRAHVPAVPSDELPKPSTQASSGSDGATAGEGGSEPAEGGGGEGGRGVGEATDGAGDAGVSGWDRAGFIDAVATRFAVIGDYGNASSGEAAVAALVADRNPSFVLTTGDNNYPSGGFDTIDANIGQFYHQFIAPYRGQYGPGAAVNRFFPSLGNHDWGTPDAAPYLDYFSLPGNERYYEVVIDDVQLFALDSDRNEPDGNTVDSLQAVWLKARLAESTSRWRVIYFHESPYSSGPHGAATGMRWPFREWGASVVISGHDHIYERLSVEGLPYVVNGVGGKSLYSLGELDPHSLVLHTDQIGALFGRATATRFELRFVNLDGDVVDELTLP